MKKWCKRAGALLLAAAFVVACAAPYVWQAGDADEETAAEDEFSARDVAADSVANRQYASEEDVTQADAWVLDLFRDLSLYLTRGSYAAWTEVDEEDAWDFQVTDDATREAASFSFSDDYLTIIDEEDASEGVWWFVDYMNTQASEGDEPFVESVEDADFTVRSSSGEETGFLFCDSLEQLAIAAWQFAVELSSEDASEDDAANTVEVNEWGYTESQMESVTITPDGEAIKKGYLHVRFVAGTSEERMREIIEEQGCTIDGESSEFAFRYETDGEGGGFEWSEDAEAVTSIFLPDGAAEWDVQAALEAYEEVAEVTTQEPNFVEVLDVATVVSTTSWDAYLQYYLSYSGFEEAWDTVRCNGTVTVGLIDTGIDYENEQLEANIDVENMANASEETVYVGGDADMTDYVFSTYGETVHGTLVAGVVSAFAGDESGCDGASYNATLLPVKYTDEAGEGDLADVARAYRYLLELESPPDVINISLGQPFDTLESGMADADVKELQCLVEKAWDMGIVTVAAAGNDGKEENAYYFPACLDTVISVGALKNPGWGVDMDSYEQELCDFSNTTSFVDICAYGQGIHTVNAYGGLLHQYATQDGTSMAAPQVSAAVALVMARNTTWDAETVVEAVLLSAESMDGVDGAGYGALDAAAAVCYEDGGQDGDDEDGDDDDASAIPSSPLPTDGYVTGAATRDAIPALLILGVASVEESGQFVDTTRWYSWSRPRYYLAASAYNVSPDPYLVNLALGSI